MVPSENAADLNAMFDDVNSLPADDPLRAPANAACSDGRRRVDRSAASVRAEVDAEDCRGCLNLLPAKVLAAFQANGGTSSATSGDRAGFCAAGSEDCARGRAKEKGAVVVTQGCGCRCPRLKVRGCGAWWSGRMRLGCGCRRWAAGWRGSRFRRRDDGSGGD